MVSLISLCRAGTDAHLPIVHHTQEQKQKAQTCTHTHTLPSPCTPTHTTSEEKEKKNRQARSKKQERRARGKRWKEGEGSHLASSALPSTQHNHTPHAYQYHCRSHKGGGSKTTTFTSRAAATKRGSSERITQNKGAHLSSVCMLAQSPPPKTEKWEKAQRLFCSPLRVFCGDSPSLNILMSSVNSEKF